MFNSCYMLHFDQLGGFKIKPPQFEMKPSPLEMNPPPVRNQPPRARSENVFFHLFFNYTIFKPPGFDDNPPGLDIKPPGIEIEPPPY